MAPSWSFLDDDDVHKADNPALRQIQELGDHLARRLRVGKRDQGVFEWKVEHCLTPLVNTRRGAISPVRRVWLLPLAEAWLRPAG